MDYTDCQSYDKMLSTVSNLLFHPTNVVDISWICYLIIYWPRILLGIHSNFRNLSRPIDYELKSIAYRVWGRIIWPIWSGLFIFKDNLYPRLYICPAWCFEPSFLHHYDLLNTFALKYLLKLAWADWSLIDGRGHFGTLENLISSKNELSMVDTFLITISMKIHWI